LLSARFSLKTSLSNIKEMASEIDEKHFEVTALKLYFTASMSMNNPRVFQRAFNELITCYQEII